MINLGDRSGRNLFDRASPDGYPEENEEYGDSNYQLQKWSYCKEIGAPLAHTLPWSWFDAEKLADPAHRDALIDHACAARCGHMPSAATRPRVAGMTTETADSAPAGSTPGHICWVKPTSLVCTA